MRRKLWTLMALLVVCALLALQAQESPGAKTLQIEIAPEEAQQLIQEATAGAIPGTRWALLVGINNYLYPESGGFVISPLRVAVRDVLTFAEFLKDPFRAAFPPEQVFVLTDEQATKRNILLTLNAIVRQAGPNDLVIFYFSGHGWYDSARGVTYLLPYDADMVDPATTCIDLADLQEKFQELKANKLITILDACHSGGLKLPGAKAVEESPYRYFEQLFSQAQGRPMLLSSDESEVSWEMPSGENSVFTHFLIEALSGAADADGDGVVTFHEAARYVEQKVPEYTQAHFPSVQRPTRRDAGGQTRGEIPLAVDLEKLHRIQEALDQYADRLAALQERIGSEADSLTRSEAEDITRFAMRIKERELRRRGLSPEERQAMELIERMIAGEMTVPAFREAIGRIYPEGLPSGEELRVLGNGTLMVLTQPMGAAIYIDGRFFSYAPRELTNLPAGRHRVRLVLAGRQAFETTVLIQDGQVTKLKHVW